MSPILSTYNSDLELANAVASAWLAEIVSAQRTERTHCVALSGGRIAPKLFAAVVEEARRSAVSLETVEFFWADERCVPPTDAESSYALAEKALFRPLELGPNRIHRIRGEEPPQFAAQQAEAEVCRIAPLNSDGQPILDLILLGMGEDGHVASLFPAHAASQISPGSVYQIVTNSPKPPPVRVTLSYAAIAAARQIWVLVSGTGKETALKQSLKADGQTPLAQVLRSQRQVRIFVDFAV